MKQTAEKGNPRMGGTGLEIILSVPAFDDGHWVFLGPTSEKQRKMRATHAHAQFNTPSVLLFSRRSGLRTQSIARSQGSLCSFLRKSSQTSDRVTKTKERKGKVRANYAVVVSLFMFSFVVCRQCPSETRKGVNASQNGKASALFPTGLLLSTSKFARMTESEGCPIYKKSFRCYSIRSLKCHH